METLVERAASGFPGAWEELWAVVEPMLVRIVKNPRFVGRVGQREPDLENVVREVAARLREDNAERLRLYVAARRDNPKLHFETWLRVVAKRAGIDYVQGAAETEDAALSGERTALLLQRAIVLLDEIELSALELWVQSASFQQIADEVTGGDVYAARAAVDRALTRLREDAAGGGHE